MSRIEVALTLNGCEMTISVLPEERLLDTLRVRLDMTGSKEGCGEGECGACTVLMDGVPACSCLVPTWQCRGRSIRTIESMEPADVEPLLATGATQCGACTPGVVMTARWITESPDVLRARSIRECMAGNLCRCTGYDGIIDGVQSLLDRARMAKGGGV